MSDQSADGGDQGLGLAGWDTEYVPIGADECHCLERGADRWPMALGRRAWWGRREDGLPITLPVVKIESVYKSAPLSDEWHGFMADLATENDVVVCLTYDPHGQPLDATDLVSLFLYVEHPATGNLCSARIEGDQAVYDAWCGDENACTDHEHGGWMETVKDAQDVFDRLAHLGRLTIKALIERPAHAR